jgi:aminoglycoside/choline kinase family phosphotransferase
MVEALPEPGFMVHGDYHVNNVMIQNGEPLLIDMDTVGYGHPVFDFASIYLAFVGYCECNHAGTMDFCGLPYETTTKVWDTLMKQYFENEAVRLDVTRKAQVIGYARMMRRTIRRNGLNTPDGQELIALCKQRFEELLPLVERLDY